VSRLALSVTPPASLQLKKGRERKSALGGLYAQKRDMEEEGKGGERRPPASLTNSLYSPKTFPRSQSTPFLSPLLPLSLEKIGKRGKKKRERKETVCLSPFTLTQGGGMEGEGSSLLTSPPQGEGRKKIGEHPPSALFSLLSLGKKEKKIGRQSILPQKRDQKKEGTSREEQVPFAAKLESRRCRIFEKKGKMTPAAIPRRSIVAFSQRKKRKGGDSSLASECPCGAP